MLGVTIAYVYLAVFALICASSSPPRFASDLEIRDNTMLTVHLLAIALCAAAAACALLGAVMCKARLLLSSFVLQALFILLTGLVLFSGLVSHVSGCLRPIASSRVVFATAHGACVELCFAELQSCRVAETRVICVLLLNPSHLFGQYGDYQVSLFVQSANGCHDTVTHTISISPKPAVDFSFNTGCAADTVHFNSSAFVNVSSTSSWVWQFGDNSTSVDPDRSAGTSADF